MKATGIVRRIDEFGRVVVPIALIKELGFDVREEIEICTEGEMIVLRRRDHSCMFCAEKKVLKEHMGKKICSDCLDEIRNGIGLEA